jgi:hypothetical protein|tara:strand:+ start:570 stop:815 length:246 start_codon:yes stop_codon:yes gene_type:complete
VREILLNAIKSYYIGNINKHIANVEIYLRTSVGIGEHSDIIEAMDKEIQQIGSYEDRLSMVVKYLDRKPEENVEGTESKKK